MKKRFIYFMILTLCLLINMERANAKLLFGENIGFKCYDVQIEEDTQKAYMICDMGFEITESPIKFNSFDASFKLINVTLADSDITLEKSWSIKKNGDSYHLSTSENTFGVGYHKIGSIKFYKIKTAEECKVEYTYSGFSYINHICTFYDNQYYDRNGNVTDELTYQKQCGVNICVQLSDGSYWGNKGVELKNKEEFDAECGEEETKHYCEVVDNEYYDITGEKTTKEKYELYCKNHYCTSISDPSNPCDKANTDGTLNGNQYWCNENKIIEYYFNKTGENVKKSEYEEDCLQHVCSIVNGHYYDKDGKKVETEEEYNASCKPIVVEEKHYCEVIDGKYYDKDGKEVSETEYNKQCKKPSCEVIDGKYYDKDGKEISEMEYNKQCKKHTCEIIDDTYFDKDGNVVSKDEYAKSCPLNTEENPSTGSFLPLIPLTILIISGIGIYYWSRKNNKLV